MSEEGGGASRTTEPAAGSSAATDISLREFLSMRIGLETKLTRAVGACIALSGAFAWREIQRRLEILNHENARLLTQQEKTVSQDTYSANEQQRKEEQHNLQAWRQEVDRDRTQSISRDEFNRDTKTDRRAGINTTTAIVAAVASALLLGLGILSYAALHRDRTPAPAVTTTVTTTTTTP